MSLIKKVTPEEIQKMMLKPLGKKHFVRAAIEQLSVGEALHVSKEAFTWKRLTPQRFCNEIEKKSNHRFTVSKEMNEGGWVVVRSS